MSDNVYFEVQKNGLADAGQVQRGDRPDRRELGRPLVGHRRRALPAPRGLSPPRRAAVRADQVDAEPAQDHASTPTSSTCAPAEEMADRVRGVAGGDRLDARDRRALRRRDRARPPADPALPDARRDGARATTCAALVDEGLRRRYGDPIPAEARRARRVRAGRDRPDGLQRLLPDRLGLRQVRQGRGHRRRARPWLGRGLDRRLLPADHRRRPAALRPAVRALPQPRARVDARYRHGLLGARPRARDPLRDRQVRQGVRSPRSSPSARCSRAPPPATPPACSATTTASATGWPS